MPQVLIDATLDHRQGRIAFAMWQRRLNERIQYEFRPVAEPDADGFQRLMCPAAGTSPTMQCSLKPKSLTKARGRNVVSLTDLLVQEKPKVCRQESSTFAPGDGAKSRQSLRYESEEWRAHYRTGRSTNEGSYGIAKRGFLHIGESSTRGIRGVAAQTVLLAFQYAAMNLSLIESFQDAQITDPTGERKQARKIRRKERTLSNYSPVIGTVNHSPPDTAMANL